MSAGAAKLDFASLPWIAAAGEILRELVAAHGEPGRRFTVCERFTDAPPQVAESGLAAWWFRIDGRSVESGAGEIAGAELEITADYATALPRARRIYTPEMLAGRSRDRAPAPGLTEAPAYLVELHNRLAELTR